MTKIIRIEGMSCMHCVKRVKTALEQLQSVSSVAVNLELNQATITCNNALSDELIKETIDDAGYDVASIEVLL